MCSWNILVHVVYRVIFIYVSGGDREPPEHGLKKYWKENPKYKTQKVYPTTFVPSYQILQTAANSAGLSTIIQEDIQEQPVQPPQVKKAKRQTNKQSKYENKLKNEYPPQNNRLQTGINMFTGEQAATNLQNLSAAVIALNGNYQGGSFISLAPGLTAGNTITIPNGVSLQSVQQQLQQQQQLQLQIQMLQQQLQSNQSPGMTHHGVQQTNENTEYMVTVSNPLEQNHVVQSVGTPVMVQTVSQPVVHNVTQSLVPNVVNSETLLPAIVDHSSGGINFVSSGGNVNLIHQTNNEVSRSTQNISLLASPITNTGEISIIAQNNAVRVLTPQTHLTENSVLTARPPQSMENYRAVHLITSQSPTMALSQPVTISLQTTPTISLSSLPTMLLTQPTSDEHQQQLIIQQASTPTQVSEQIIIHPPVQSNTDQLVIQQSATQSSSEQTTISSSVLPSMTSFNADAFLTGAGNTTYAVVNNDTLTHIQRRQVLDEHERQLEQASTMQVSYLQS